VTEKAAPEAVTIDIPVEAADEATDEG